MDDEKKPAALRVFVAVLLLLCVSLFVFSSQSLKYQRQECHLSHKSVNCLVDSLHFPIDEFCQ